MDYTSIAALEQATRDKMAEVLADPDSYLEQNRGDIKEYLAYKMSDEFKTSLPGKLQQTLLEFQRQGGYQEVFLENIRTVRA